MDTCGKRTLFTLPSEKKVACTAYKALGLISICWAWSALDAVMRLCSLSNSVININRKIKTEFSNKLAIYIGIFPFLQKFLDGFE